MARKPSNYWEKRSTELMKNLEVGTQYTINDLIEIYERATKNINKEIENIFKNYAKNTTLNKEALKVLLNKRETDEHYKKMFDTINSIDNEELKKQLITRYNAPAYSYRISRFQALQDNIDVEMQKLADLEQTITEIRYVKTIDDSYNRTVYNIQHGVGLGFSFSQLNMNVIKLMLAERWVDNKNFSERIWKNTEKLGNYLKTNLIADTISGKSVAKMSRQLSDYMNVGLYNAATLIRTEVNYFANKASLLAYKESGIDKYQYIATLDTVTCDRCANLDNKIFNIEEAAEGTNCPPMHPNDRCTHTPYINDEVLKEMTRRAEDKNGKSILVPADMNYQEWKKHYNIDILETKQNSKLQKTNNYDKITSNNLFDKLNITAEDYVPFGKYDPFDNNIQEQAAELLNIANKPKLVSKEYYDNYKGTEIVRFVHDYSGITAQGAYENTLHGNIRYSEKHKSSYGRGIYFGEKAREEEIKEFYSAGNSKIINAKISSNANIMEFKNQSEYIEEISKRLKNVPPELQQIYQNERSLLFMLDGIDGIKINSNGYYCIYNREVLVINEQ